MKKPETIELEINVKLSLWNAIKLRIAGLANIKGDKE